MHKSRSDTRETVLFRPVITIVEEAAFEAMSLGSGTPVVR